MIRSDDLYSPACTGEGTVILYKYYSEAGLNRFMTDLHLRFTPPLAFNDPFEVRPTLGTDEERRLQKLSGFEADAFFDFDFGRSLRSFLNFGIGLNMGILCLSEDPGEPLMWAHYADCHRGAVVGFDASHAFFSKSNLENGFRQFLKPVAYAQERSVLPLAFFKKHQMEEIARTGWQELLNREDPMFYTKSVHWRYEKEWRLVRQLLDPPSTPAEWSKRILGAKYEIQKVRPEQLISIPTKAVRSITFGDRARQEQEGRQGWEDDIVDLLGSNQDLSHIELWKARLDSRSYSVVRFSLDNDSDLKRNVHPQEYIFRLYGYLGRTPR